MATVIQPPELKEILADELDRQHFLTAGRLSFSFGDFPWYDAQTRYRLAFALRYLERVRPDKVAEFSNALIQFRTDRSFSPIIEHDFLDLSEFGALQQCNAILRDQAKATDESRMCGRNKFNDLPELDALHQRLTGWVEGKAGEPVVPSFSLLAHYGSSGLLPMHIDSQESKWTLGICIERSVDWPIYISNVVDCVPEPEQENWDPELLKSDAQLAFKPYSLGPNEAILYSASSQWHYRDLIPASDAGFYDIALFQYVPAGSEAMIKHERWASHFQCRELETLSAYFRWAKQGSTLAHVEVPKSDTNLPRTL